MCLKTSWFGVYGFKCKWAVYYRPVSRKGHHVYVSALHSDGQLVEATWQSERTSVQPYIWESNALKVGRNSAMLQSSMDRAARPWYRTNLVLWTAWTNLTSAVPTASSATQTIGENEDSYVQAYMQTQSTGLHVRWRYSCSSAEKMKDSVTAEGRNYSRQGCQSNPVVPPSKIWRHTAVSVKTAGLVRLTWFKGIKKWGVDGFLSL